MVEKTNIPPSSKRSSKIGLEPGSLAYVGSQKTKLAEFQIISYSKDQFTLEPWQNQFSLDSLKQILNKKDTLHWVHFNGVHNVEFINQVREIFSLDALVVEDILNSDQRPKVEELDSCLFVLIKYIRNIHSKKVTFDQISFILTQQYLFTFSDEYPVCFDHVVKKMERSASQIRNNRLDFLLYFLLDAIIDEYFLMIEHFNEVLDHTDQMVSQSKTPGMLQNIQFLKKEIKDIKKVAYPIQEVIFFLEKSKSPFFQKNTFRYLKDLSEHIHYIKESVESMKDSINGTMELYLSNLNAKTNEVVKVLTLISSIFIPLTFIVGVYGMNFKYMPELSWPYGYYFSWGIMLLVALGMLILFKVKKWL